MHCWGPVLSYALCTRLPCQIVKRSTRFDPPWCCACLVFFGGVLDDDSDDEAELQRELDRLKAERAKEYEERVRRSIFLLRTCPCMGRAHRCGF